MKLVPYDMQKSNLFSYRGYKRSNNLKILEEFIDSDLDCAKVEGFTQKNATTAAKSLNNSIKRYKFLNIHANARKNNLFLIKIKWCNYK